MRGHDRIRLGAVLLATLLPAIGCASVLGLDDWTDRPGASSTPPGDEGGPDGIGSVVDANGASDSRSADAIADVIADAAIDVVVDAGADGPVLVARYDLADEFSYPNNPNGVWSYGWTSALGTTFALLNTPVSVSQDVTRFLLNVGHPSVTSNKSGAVYSFQTWHLPPGFMMLHPGQSGQYSVVRWTAPAGGAVNLNGKFQALDQFGTTSDVAIRKNATISVFSGDVTGYPPTASAIVPFNVDVPITTGDTIDFVVGYGSNLAYERDSTGLIAILQLN